MEYFPKVGDLLDWSGYCMVIGVTSTVMTIYCLKQKRIERYIFDRCISIHTSSVKLVVSV